MSEKKDEGRRGKVWVLDTETKGTGAEMVPLDKVSDPSRRGHGVIVVEGREPRPKKAVEPRGPRKFKVVDVMTQKELAEGTDLRATVELLESLRSSVDVSVYVWEEKAGRWQQLTQREQQMLWELRGRERPAPA
jgi:hypothetical protein